MSDDEKEDEVNLVLPYAVSEPTSSPPRNKFGKISRLTEAERLRHDAIKNLNIDPITYPHTIHRQPDRYLSMCIEILQIPIHVSIWKTYNHGYILEDNTKDQIIHFQY